MRCTKAGISIKALRHNYDIVRSRVGGNVKIMGIVKANAYGHGMAVIAGALESFGCEYLAVAFLEEGIALRNAGIRCPILVLTGAWADQADEYQKFNLQPTLTTAPAAEAINRAAARSATGKMKVQIKIDTGMERQGVRSPEALQFIRTIARMSNIEIEGIYSHLAISEEPENSFTGEQLARFQGLLRDAGKEGIVVPQTHIANSGGVIHWGDSHASLVRPGIMLYGYAPGKADPMNAQLRPVLSLTSAVMFVKRVPAGTSISYGRTYFTKSETTIATVPIGYGDGFSRSLSNRASVLIHGKRCPVVGTVCMDQIMVDAGPAPQISVGDNVTIIGRDGDEAVTAWDVAGWGGTIPYEVLTGIADRVPRMVIS